MARTGCWSHTERVLLTYEQVRAYELPATEGKHGDPRWPAFARRYGFDPRCPVRWEVEARESAELRRLVLTAVGPYIDRGILARQIAREEEHPRALAAFLDGWDAAGRGSTGQLHPLQQAFIDQDAFQRGYCTPRTDHVRRGLCPRGSHLEPIRPRSAASSAGVDRNGEWPVSSRSTCPARADIRSCNAGGSALSRSQST